MTIAEANTDANRTGEYNSTRLSRATALQSLVLLRSAKDLYEAVRLNDPYKHEPWTLADAQHVLDEWRRHLRRVSARGVVSYGLIQQMFRWMVEMVGWLDFQLNC